MPTKKIEKQLAVTQDKITFSNEQIELIKKQIAPDSSDAELKLFLYQAQRTGLDPLARQIYFVSRNVKNPRTGSWEKKGTIQTSIDGFRVIAERSGDYAGQDEPEFEEGNGYPKLCKVRVYKFAPNGQRYQAAVGVAYWSEYVQTSPNGEPKSMWAKMPHTMLSKTAEALALRKAFPQDLSGLYTDEEMNQAEDAQKHEVIQSSNIQKVDPKSEANIVEDYNAVPDKAPVISNGEVAEEVIDEMITRDQKTEVMILLGKKGKNVVDLNNAIKGGFHKENLASLTKSEAYKLIAKLRTLDNAKVKETTSDEAIEELSDADLDAIDKALSQ